MMSEPVSNTYRAMAIADTVFGFDSPAIGRALILLGLNLGMSDEQAISFAKEIRELDNLCYSRWNY